MGNQINTINKLAMDAKYSQLSPTQKFSTVLKNFSRAVPIAAAFWIGTGLATSTSAATVNGTISGEVTSVIGFVQGVTPGSTVSGNYSYDDTITISNDQYPGLFGHPIQAFKLSIGNNPVAFNFSDISGITLSSQATVLFGNITTPPPNVQILDFFLSSSAVSSFLGVPGGTDGIGFEAPQDYSIQAIPENNPRVEFTFTAAVPEPSSTVGLPVLGLFWLLRKKVLTSRRT
jgi:hypothetical protein